MLHSILGDYLDRGRALEHYSRDRTVNGAAAAALSMDNYSQIASPAPPPRETALAPPAGAPGLPPAPILVNFHGLSYSEAYARLRNRPKTGGCDLVPAGGTYVRHRTW